MKRGLLVIDLIELLKTYEPSKKIMLLGENDTFLEIGEIFNGSEEYVLCPKIKTISSCPLCSQLPKDKLWKI